MLKAKTENKKWGSCFKDKKQKGVRYSPVRTCGITVSQLVFYAVLCLSCKDFSEIRQYANNRGFSKYRTTIVRGMIK